MSATLLRKIVHKAKIPLRTAQPIKLTDKETEVLKLICADRTAGEIANEIYLRQLTVEGLRTSMLEKTGARNTAGLVVYAMKNGIFL